MWVTFRVTQLVLVELEFCWKVLSVSLSLSLAHTLSQAGAGVGAGSFFYRVRMPISAFLSDAEKLKAEGLSALEPQGVGEHLAHLNVSPSNHPSVELSVGSIPPYRQRDPDWKHSRAPEAARLAGEGLTSEPWHGGQLSCQNRKQIRGAWFRLVDCVCDGISPCATEPVLTGSGPLGQDCTLSHMLWACKWSRQLPPFASWSEQLGWADSA